MTSLLLNLPAEFFIALALFAVGAFVALNRLRTGMGVPMLAVLATVFFWYVGDVAYNDYYLYRRQFPASVIGRAWGQVALFLASFLGFLTIRKQGGEGQSQIYELYRRGNYQDPEYQQVFRICFQVCVAIWVIAIFFALIQNPSRIFGFLMPILGNRYDPFIRPQIGGGFSAVVSLVQYLYLLAGAGFGIVFALSNRPRLRAFAMFFCISVWSFYLLDRTRNSLVVVVLPCFLAWLFIRMRSSLPVKLLILAAGVAIFEIWFSFVMEVRGLHKSVSSAFFESGVSSVVESSARHGGLNMFEELCWITRFLDTGRITPSYGERYFAEVVNFIPRGLWSEKPVIALDYAIARGQHFRNDGSVSATISTGLIGQGTTNFGIVFGPIFAAFLMSIWVRVLASIDASRQSVKLPLFFLGIVLTFNMGRDISLLILYPFVFGYMAFVFMDNRRARNRIRGSLSVDV